MIKLVQIIGSFETLGVKLSLVVDWGGKTLLIRE